MLVSAMRQRLLRVVKRGNATYAPADLDYAIQQALHELDLYARVRTQDFEFETTNGSNTLDLSTDSSAATTYIRPDRIRRVEIDGILLTLVDLGTIMRLLSDSGQPAYDYINNHLANEDIPDDEPSHFAVIPGQQTARLYPTPLAVYTVTVRADSPIDEWTAGEEDPDIDLPSSVLFPAIDLGAAAHLEPSAPEGPSRLARWEALKPTINARLTPAPGEGIKDDRVFLDPSDDRCAQNVTL